MFRLPCVMLIFFFIIAPTVKVASALEKPNILFILIDDLGWMDLEFQGNQLVDTPALNRFAKQGMRFTDAYAAAPVCSPTRAAIMTGLFPARLKITNHIPDQPRFIPDEPKVLPANMLNYLPSERITVAELLKNAGYSTAFLGKWHLSGTGRGEAKWEPTAQGFELNIGGCAYGGPPTFFDPYRIPNLPDRQKGEYLPDRLADEAINYMKKADRKPFFLCLWNYTVHWPMEAPDELLKKYKGREGDGLNDTRYGAMIEAMDRSMGRILQFLDDSGLSENTLVVFTSDNGGFGGVADNRPLRAEKGYLYEGGIRVPLVVRWPGVVSPETIESTPVISTDFFPTLLEAASVKVP
ncbi:MAG: sulfatase, partial [Pirellulaceae bacterium]